MSFYGLVDGTDASLKSYLGNLSGVDQVGAEARAAMLATRSIKTTCAVFESFSITSM